MSRQNSVTGRWLVSLFMLVLVACGIGMLIRTFAELRESWESTSWPVATGKITRSHLNAETLSVRRRGEDGIRRTVHEDSYTAEIEYEFELDGVVHKGNRISVVQGGNLADESHVQMVLDRYPVGRQVNVSYHPQDAKQCVLEPGSWGGFFVYVGLSCFLIVLPVIVTWVVWHPKHSKLISGL